MKNVCAVIITNITDNRWYLIDESYFNYFDFMIKSGELELSEMEEWIDDVAHIASGFSIKKLIDTVNENNYYIQDVLEDISYSKERE